MLQTIRDRATGWFAYIIIGLLIIPFALWGINQYFGGSGKLVAAEVGGQNVSLQEFQRAFQSQRQRLQNLLGDRFDPALLEGNRFKQEVLQSLVNDRVLLEGATQLGLRIGDQQLKTAILSFEAFKKDGKFDRELYERVLRSQGYSETAFEASLRNSLLIDQLRQGLISSAFVTSAGMERDVGLLNQKRQLELVVLPLANQLEKVTVDEAAIEAYYQENKERLLSPEQVQVHYLELKPEQLTKDIVVSEDELHAAYEEQIAKYTQPEERKASQILITLAAGANAQEVDKARVQAQAMYQEIMAGGKTLEQVLQESQAQGRKDVQGGELGTISKGMMDPAFESALFGLKSVGDISEPVRTAFGFHIIRLDGIVPEQVKSFAEVRDELAKELRLRKAEERFYDAAENLANLTHEHPDSLEPAAAALGLTILESPSFTRQGGGGIAVYPKVVAAGFSEDVLKRGFNSEPIEVEPNHVVVIRLQEHKEAKLLSLEQARAEISSRLRDRSGRDTLRKDAEALLQRAMQGQALATLAKEFNGEFKETGLVSRSDASLDSAVLEEAFRLSKPEQGKLSMGVAELGNGDRAVVAVKGVQPGRVEDLEEAERKSLRERLGAQIGALQFQSFLAALRAQTKIVIYSDRL
jgi:peptidyl-prolyl cis-trans isomerase D